MLQGISTLSRNDYNFKFNSWHVCYENQQQHFHYVTLTFLFELNPHFEGFIFFFFKT